MICKYAEIFCWKNVSSFCSAKATHIFSAKNIGILYIESAKIVNEMTLNELVKLTTLWTTGPWILKVLYNNKFIFVETSFGTNVVITRVCCRSHRSIFNMYNKKNFRLSLTLCSFVELTHLNLSRMVCYAYPLFSDRGIWKKLYTEVAWS